MPSPDQFALFETHFQHAPVGLGIVDREFRYIRVNDCLAEMNGLPAEAHRGRAVRDVVPRLWPTIESMYRAALQGETLLKLEISGPTRDEGEDGRHRLVRYFPVHQGGEVVGVGIVVSDITDYRRMENALRVRTDLYAMLAQTNRAVSERTTIEVLYRDICRIAVETGHFRLAWVGVSDGVQVRRVASAGEDGGYLAEMVITLEEADPRSHGPGGRAMTTGQPCVINDFLAAPEAAPWHEQARRVGFAAVAAFPLTEGGRVAAVLILYADQRDFFTAELVEALGEIAPVVAFALDAFAREREEERENAALHLRDRAINAVSQGISITDPRQPDNPIIFASPGFERLTGYPLSEVLGRNCRFLQGAETDPEAVARIREAVRAGVGCTVELRNYRKDGTAFWNELTISPVVDDQGVLTHLVGIQADVTGRHNLEQAVRQAQKMEAVGQLASGVAHDFNNVLTVIGGWSDALESTLPASDASREVLLEIRRAVERAGTLTRQLLAFSRKQLVTPMVLDLNAVVTESEKLIRRLIGVDIRLTTRTTRRLWPTRADPGQIEQVLVNLAANARDAMPMGGTLTISTGLAPSNALPPGIPAGDYVVLEVQDSGTGMDEATRARIFDPLFTTKPDGRGTGLGLATVRMIVTQAGGQITVDSALKQGSTFRIYLPRALTPLPEPSSRLPTDAMPQGNETILLVEDEDAVRGLSRHVLKSCGYTVLEASNGIEALEVVRNYRGTIHLAISDVVMPHLSGRRLAEALRAARPEARILFISGYTDDEVVRHGIELSEVEFLGKPFTRAGLSQKVRDVLDLPRQPAAG